MAEVFDRLASPDALTEHASTFARPDVLVALGAGLAGAGRTELAAQEQYELEVIESYLPEQLGRDEIARLVDEAIAETGASGVRDMGRVMSAVMPRVRGQADGKMVSEVVRQKLG